MTISTPPPATGELKATDTSPSVVEVETQGMGVSASPPGSREPDQQAVPALRASIPDAARTCAECGSPCPESKLGLPPACCWGCAAKIDARKHTKAAIGQQMGFCGRCHRHLPLTDGLCRGCAK